MVLYSHYVSDRQSGRNAHSSNVLFFFVFFSNAIESTCGEITPDDVNESFVLIKK